MRSFPMIMFTIAGLIWLNVTSAWAKEYTFSYQKIIDIEQPVVLQLNLVRGSVYLSGGDEDRLIIEAVKRIRATDENEAEEVADHIEIKVEVLPEEIDINTNYLRMLSRSPSFWQKVLGAGSDSYGSVDYRISLPLKSSVQIRSMVADIELSSIEGEIQIDNTAGKTHGEFLFGPVTIRQPQGKIDLRWVEGDIRIKSSSAAITIQQSHGAIDLVTLNGEVNIQTELDSPRDYLVETNSGSITFMIPEASSGVLNIETQTGDVQTEMPVAIKSVSSNRLVGEFGRGGPTIKLSSSSGDVTVALY
jgi:hypothetical protein